MHAPFDIAADLDTPVSAYRKLAAFEPVFLLESVEHGTTLGRYSFIGLGVTKTVRLVGDTLEVDGKARPAGTGAELLAVLRQELATCPRMAAGGTEGLKLPFQGGLVGSIGYDFVRRVERLPRLAIREADAPELNLVSPRSVLVFDHSSRRAALLHSGAEWERQSLRREIIGALRGAVGPASLRTGHEPPRASMSREVFTERFGTVKEHIAKGDVFQLVLSVRFSGQCRTEPFEVYRALRLTNPSPYMYLLELPGQTLVGSSPEALVKLENGVASLRPIAGTRKRGATEQLDVALETELLADAKEAAEHVMLVDLARNDLGRVAEAGTVAVGPYRSIERYSHVMHIVSGVQGRLKPGKDALDLLAATFPAGTVVGAPKVKAMEIIEQNEPVGRGFYAGTVGYLSVTGDLDMAIAIRTIEFRDGRYAYQAGAGIVEASTAEAEYEEIRSKVGALERAMDLAAEGIG